MNHRLQNRQAKEFDRLARQYGFKLVRHGKHLTYHREGCPPLVVSGTPSDGRAIKNNIARMKRMVRQAENSKAA